MAIRMPSKVQPSKSDLDMVRNIVDRYVDKRWRPYMLFKGEWMLMEGYSVSDIEKQFSGNIKV